MAPVADPIHVLRGLLAYPRFFADWQRYSLLEGAERISVADVQPQLHDRTLTSPIDPHYFLVNSWAARRIVAEAPRYHVDIASQAMFVGLLSAVVPTVFVEYRPLRVRLAGLYCLGGSLLELPFADKSIASLSCLHVIEHVGLGRYGDVLHPNGTQVALTELARVLAPGGNLLLATPVGRERLCFNAHRIYAVRSILMMVPQLSLVEFSGIDDQHAYHEGIDPGGLEGSDYACGLFWFRKPG